LEAAVLICSGKLEGPGSELVPTSNVVDPEGGGGNRMPELLCLQTSQNELPMTWPSRWLPVVYRCRRNALTHIMPVENSTPRTNSLGHSFVSPAPSAMSAQSRAYGATVGCAVICLSAQGGYGAVLNLSGCLWCKTVSSISVMSVLLVYPKASVASCPSSAG